MCVDGLCSGRATLCETPFGPCPESRVWGQCLAECAWHTQFDKGFAWFIVACFGQSCSGHRCAASLTMRFVLRARATLFCNTRAFVVGLGWGTT
jgi:hypothetical protein